MFITFEGGEGSGKTTQAKLLYDYLYSLGHDCVLTREPGGTFIGSKIRSVLLDPANTGISQKTEFYLYAADRFQHIHEVIKPGLGLGKIVICDRYMDSTSVYQGAVRGVDVSIIDEINSKCPVPNLTFIMDIDPEIGLLRAAKGVDSGERNENETRFEREEINFHMGVRDAYLKISDSDYQKSKRFIEVIDASATKDEIFAEIICCIDSLKYWGIMK